MEPLNVLKCKTILEYWLLIITVEPLNIGIPGPKRLQNPTLHCYFMLLCSDMVTQLLETMGDDLDNRMDECCSAIINNNSEMDSKYEKYFILICTGIISFPPFLSKGRC